MSQPCRRNALEQLHSQDGASAAQPHIPLHARAEGPGCYPALNAGLEGWLLFSSKAGCKICPLEASPCRQEVAALRAGCRGDTGVWSISLLSPANLELLESELQFPVGGWEQEAGVVWLQLRWWHWWH